MDDGNYQKSNFQNDENNKQEESSRLGSEHRRQRLEVRRSLAIYDQLWKQHEKGFLADARSSTCSEGCNNDGVVEGRYPAHFRPSLSVHDGRRHRASSLATNAGRLVDLSLVLGGGGVGASRCHRCLSSSVTAAKVHRISVTSALVARKSSSMVGDSRQRRRAATSFSHHAKSHDFEAGKARRKSVCFADKEDHLTSRKQNDVEEKGVDGKCSLPKKKMKPCLIKKKPNDELEHGSNNKVNFLSSPQLQQDRCTSKSYCSGGCLPFFRFFALFRRPSISTDAENDIKVRAMPQIPVKEDDNNADIPEIPGHRTARWIIRNRSNSFDETMTCERVGAVLARQHTSSSHGMLKRTFSDDCLQSEIRTPSQLHGVEMLERPNIDNSNDDDDDLNNDLDYYDAWLSHILYNDFPDGSVDAFDNNYAHLLESPSLNFSILGGSSANDTSALPHVLSPPLMQSLQAHLPWSKRGENLWLKYSRVRDGACMPSLLQLCRGAKYSFLAIETIGGDVFGAFCGQPWRESGRGHYGSAESFVWKLKHARKEVNTLRSVFAQAAIEREIEVYPYAHNNDFIQVCKSDYLSVGGGSGDTVDTYTILPGFAEAQDVEYHDWGPAIHLTKTLLQGTSSPCLTFCSPALCPRHADGSLCEIINLEVWVLTPAINIAQAEKVECGQLFFAEQSNYFKRYALA